MIVDTSALLAILFAEQDASGLCEGPQGSVAAADVRSELARSRVVVDRRRAARASSRFDDLISETGIALEPVTVEQARIAREAYRKFGKGSGSPVPLNYGDCFAYALAKATGEPLPFKGNDFRHTDVTPAI